MIHRWQLDLPAEEFDPSLCLLTGQVFRFTKGEDGSISGSEGQHWHRLTPSPTGWMAESSSPPEALHSLIRKGDNRQELLAEITRLAPELSTSLSALPGLRLLRPSSRAEVYIGFLCSANNTLHRIMPMVRRLAELGDPIPGPGTAFPPLSRIAALDPADLRRAGFGYRAERVVEAACHAVEQGGEEWLDHLAEIGWEEARAELRKVKGIGAKVADCICLFGLDQTEAVPVDTHVWQAVCEAYRPDWTGKSLTEARCEEAGWLLRSRLGPLSGWAQQFLYSGSLLRRRKDLRPSSAPPSSSS